MKVLLQRIFLIFLVAVVVYSCSPSSNLSPKLDKGIFVGRVPDSTYKSLKQFLTNTISSKVNDTIIIKYDFNNQACWINLDQYNKEYIMGFVARVQNSVREKRIARPNVTFLNFREPGNKSNKIKKWDDTVLIDSSKQLFNLIFSTPYICGSSIIVLPDRRFVLTRSDSHSAGFNYTKQQIEDFLK